METSALDSTNVEDAFTDVLLGAFSQRAEQYVLSQ